MSPIGFDELPDSGEVERAIRLPPTRHEFRSALLLSALAGGVIGGAAIALLMILVRG